MGIKLREIIEDIGGGVPGGHKLKAVQTGGPSGGCIPADMLGLGVSYDALMAAGSIMGSGGMIVMDDTSCMVNVARFFIEFCMTESCGKCIPCRAGTAQMHTLLTRICTGTATLDDLEMLEELCDTVKKHQPVRARPDSAESSAEHAASTSATSTSNTLCTSAARPAYAPWKPRFPLNPPWRCWHERHR